MVSQSESESQSPQFEGGWYPRLIDAIVAAQTQLVGEVKRGPLFEDLLRAILELTGSEGGIIGETLVDDSGQPYLRTHAVINIAWEEQTLRLHEEQVTDGTEPAKLETLLGRVLSSEAPVMANSPSVDARSAGLPEGAPPLEAFLGIPLCRGGVMVGVVGVANRAEGYENELVARLEPLFQTCANAICALRAEREREQAEDRLRREEACAKSVLNGVVEAVITVDEGGLVESFNAAAERIFGYTESDISGRSVSLLMPNRMRLVFEQHLDQYVGSGRARILGQQLEVEARRSDGSTFQATLSVSEVRIGERILLTGILRDLSEHIEAEKKIEGLREEVQRKRLGRMIGSSQSMQQLYQVIGEVAFGNWTVLIKGETGSGKELVARAIHAASPRSDEPFVAVNCAGLSDPLLHSQLFGHRRGAFTGAMRDQRGLFQAADGGTLFLDEIGDISNKMQTSLLRALQEGEIVRIGDTRPKQVNVRVVAATNRDLEMEVKAGRFREDLFYRLRVARVAVPPLRERGNDVVMLAEAVLAEARVTSGKTVTGLSREATERLLSHDWPGNVRELRSAVQHGVIHCQGDRVDVQDLPPEFQGPVVEPSRSVVVEAQPLDERERVLKALDRAGGNRSRAARDLGIGRATLYRRLKSLGIDESSSER